MNKPAGHGKRSGDEMARIPSPPDSLLEGVPFDPIELRLLGLLAAGWRQDEIAAQMKVSGNTVSTRLARIRSKLGARSAAQALYLWGLSQPRVVRRTR